MNPASPNAIEETSEQRCLTRIRELLATIDADSGSDAVGHAINRSSVHSAARASVVSTFRLLVRRLLEASRDD